MSETIAIITLITSIAGIITPLFMASIYAFRKIKKSSCFKCIDLEMQEDKEKDENKNILPFERKNKK